jgi:hypothetical protein
MLMSHCQQVYTASRKLSLNTHHQSYSNSYLGDDVATMRYAMLHHGSQFAVISYSSDS